MHARWASYFEQFNFVIRHKSRVDNKVLDAIEVKSFIVGPIAKRNYWVRVLEEAISRCEDFVGI